jgi:hypothetical protein
MKQHTYIMLLYKEDSVEKQMFAFFAMTILDVIM